VKYQDLKFMNKNNENKLIPKHRFPEFNDGWKKVKLRDVSSYFNGGSYENDVKEEGKYELITLKSINTNGKLVNSKRYIDTEAPTLTKGTLIMILSEQAPGLLGMTAIIPSDNKYVLNQRVAEIRPNQKVESYFLSMAINRNQSYFSKQGAGMKVQNISKPNVEKYEFSLPDILEQKKIASCFSSLDEIITSENEKLELLLNHKRGLLQNLLPVGDETVPKCRFNGFEDESSEWHEDTLINIARFRRGSFPQPYGLPEWYDDENGTPFIQVFDVGEDFRLKPTTKRKISELAAKQSVYIPKGTLIITIQGSIGRVAITQYDAYIDRTLLLFEEFYQEIDIPFFAYTLFLLFEIEKQKAPGGIIKTITKEVLSSFVVKLPSIEEQRKISSCLSSLDELITAQIQKIEALQKHKKGLLQDMFPSINNEA
jgi:type I restriction enzyme S subunit